MLRSALFGTVVALAALPVPAVAQQEDRVLVIYGNDRCPTSSGQDIVVCARKPEGERYRIPSELREGGVNNWRERAKSLEYVGAGGTSSCTPTGAGGWTGCFGQIMRAAKAERQASGTDTTISKSLGITGSGN